MLAYSRWISLFFCNIVTKLNLCICIKKYIWQSVPVHIRYFVLSPVINTPVKVWLQAGCFMFLYLQGKINSDTASKEKCTKMSSFESVLPWHIDRMHTQELSQNIAAHLFRDWQTHKCTHLHAFVLIQLRKVMGSLTFKKISTKHFCHWFWLFFSFDVKQTSM